jgi:tRNA pseudouridine38-40 synthase
MARYKVILAYDGTAFSGMQRQANVRSVQGEVEAALKQVGWPGQSILAAGRTDAGVHASGQVIAFDFEWAHEDRDLHNALNATLPEDVAVQGLARSADDFHPRYDAKSRTYRYRTYSQPDRDPLRERYAWRVWPLIDLDEAQAAAKLLEGSHDFRAFGTPPKPDGPTVREVFLASWQKVGADEYVFEISANAFLYHMVRRIVSTLVEVGQGTVERDAFWKHVEAPGGMLQGLAPPNGSSLVRVDYN